MPPFTYVPGGQLKTLLIQEPPLQVLPSLASAIGLEEALVLQQIHYWLVKSSHIVNGKPWVYNTIREWLIQFPFLSERTLYRIMASLRDKGIIEVDNTLNKLPMDRTNWYTIRYDNVSKLSEDTAKLAASYGHPDIVDNVSLAVSNQESTDHRLLAVDGALQARGGRKKAPPEIHPNSSLILKAYLDALGYEPDSYGREATAAKKMAQKGYTPEDVLYVYHTLKAQPYWATKHLSLTVILRDMPALAHYTKQGGDITKVGKTTTKAQATAQANRSLQDRLIAEGKGHLLE